MLFASCVVVVVASDLSCSGLSRNDDGLVLLISQEAVVGGIAERIHMRREWRSNAGDVAVRACPSGASRCRCRLACSRSTGREQLAIHGDLSRPVAWQQLVWVDAEHDAADVSVYCVIRVSHAQIVQDGTFVQLAQAQHVRVANERRGQSRLQRRRGGQIIVLATTRTKRTRHSNECTVLIGTGAFWRSGGRSVACAGAAVEPPPLLS